MDVAHQVAELGATGITKDMLRLMQSFAVVDGRPEIVGKVRARALAHVSEYLHYYLAPKVESTKLVEQQRWAAEELLEQAVNTLAEIAKTCIDRRDLQTFTLVSREWRRILEFWVQENARTYLPDSLDKQLAVAVQDAVSRLRFAVFAWLLYRLWTSPLDTIWRQMAEVSKASYRSVDEVVNAARMADPEDGPQSIFADWLLDDKPPDEVHMIDTETPLLRALVVAMLAADRPDSIPRMAESRWLLLSKDKILAQVDAVAESQAFLDAVGFQSIADEDFKDRVAKGVEEAAARQSAIDEAAVLASEVSDAVRDQVAREVQRTWEEARRGLGVLLSTGGTLHQDEGPMTTNKLELFDWWSKAWAVRADRLMGLNAISTRLGRRLAEMEEIAVYDAWLAAPEIDGSLWRDLSLAQSVVPRAEALLAELDSNGYRSSLLMVSYGFGSQLNLPVSPVPDSFHIRRLLPAVDVVGMWNGLLVCRSARLPEGVMLSADVARWGGLWQWNIAQGSPVEVRLTEFDDELARITAAADPALFHVAMQEADKIMWLRQHVRLTVLAAVEVRTTDGGAVRVSMWDHPQEDH